MPTFISDDVSLSYRDAGQGRPLLLIHAFPLSGAMWEPQLTALGRHMRVIAPDLRGFGASPLAIAPASLDTYADDLAALLDHLGLERVTFAGLSMGGYIAFAFLRRHPQRISTLILADTRAGADSAEARAGRERNALLAESDGAAAVGAGMLPRLLGPSASESIRARIRRIIATNSGAGVAAALRCMAARPDSSELLPTIAVPTLVLVGDKDVLTPPEEARQMHAAIPGSRLAIIEGAGHLTNLEAPELFNQAVLEFLAHR